MRIWLINHYAVPEGGSWASRHAILARHLTSLGHEVTIFASALPDGRKVSAEVPRGRRYVERWCGEVRFRFVRTSAFRSKAARFGTMLEFRHNACRSIDGLDPPDVVIGSCVHLHAADAGRRLARCARAPFVFEVRDVWPETLADIGAMSRLHPVYLYLRAIERRLYRDASRVITLLPGMSEYLEKNGVSRDRICYLPNGVDPALFAELPAPEGPFTVTFFGAHGYANGLDTVVRCAARTPQARFRFIGDGTEKNALRQLAAQLGAENVELLDPVPKRELAVLAASSHAFVFHLRDMAVLRKYGVSANKLFDYLLAARPVVFACASANDPVKEAGAGLSVPPQDPEALAGAIARLMALSAGEREEMGRRGRAWVVEHHDLARLAARLDTLVREIRSGRS